MGMSNQQYRKVVDDLRKGRGYANDTDNGLTALVEQAERITKTQTATYLIYLGGRTPQGSAGRARVDAIRNRFDALHPSRLTVEIAKVINDTAYAAMKPGPGHRYDADPVALDRALNEIELQICAAEQGRR